MTQRPEELIREALQGATYGATAEAELVRILDSTPATAQPRRRRPKALAALAVGLIVALTALPFAQPQATAQWTPIPEPLDAAAQSSSIEQCLELDPTAGATHWTPVIGERRDDWTLVFVVDETGEHYGECATMRLSGKQLPRGFGIIDRTDRQPAPDSLTLLLDGRSATDTSGWPDAPKAKGHYHLFGRVGQQVDKLVVHTERTGDVLAHIHDGYWTALWPIQQFGINLTHPDDDMTGVTLTTHDGKVTQLDPAQLDALRG